jgi:hypothetical protein
VAEPPAEEGEREIARAAVKPDNRRDAVGGSAEGATGNGQRRRDNVRVLLRRRGEGDKELRRADANTAQRYTSTNAAPHSTAKHCIALHY